MLTFGNSSVNNVSSGSKYSSSNCLVCCGCLVSSGGCLISSDGCCSMSSLVVMLFVVLLMILLALSLLCTFRIGGCCSLSDVVVVVCLLVVCFCWLVAFGSSKWVCIFCWYGVSSCVVDAIGVYLLRMFDTARGMYTEVVVTWV